MTPQQELERIVDLAGLNNVLSLLSMICGERAVDLAPTNASAAKDYAKYADALDSAIVKMWGRL